MKNPQSACNPIPTGVLFAEEWAEQFEGFVRKRRMTVWLYEPGRYDPVNNVFDGTILPTPLVIDWNTDDSGCDGTGG